MNAHDIELALRARAAFNDSADRLDAGTRQRLRELRLRALDGDARRNRVRWMWPAAGMAAAAVLALVVFVPRLPQAPTTANPASSAALVAPQRITTAIAVPTNASQSVATASDSSETAALETADPDMLSDLEFYGWLAKQPGDGNTGG